MTIPSRDSKPSFLPPVGGIMMAQAPAAAGGPDEEEAPPAAPENNGNAQPAVLPVDLDKTNYFSGLRLMGSSADVASTNIARALQNSINATAENVSKLTAANRTQEAQLELQKQQALLAIVKDINALYLDMKIAPFKIARAFAQGLGLTVIS